MKRVFFSLSFLCLVFSVATWFYMSPATRPAPPTAAIAAEMPFNGSPITQLHVLPMEDPTAVRPPSNGKAIALHSSQQVIALDQDESKSPSKDGPKPALLGNGKVTIALPDLSTSPSLNAIVAKLDTLLTLLQLLAGISSGGIALPLVVRAVSGLRDLLAARSPNVPAAFPGQPAPSPPVNQAALYLTPEQANLLASLIGRGSGTGAVGQSPANS